MPALSRSALGGSPLSDLHALALELGIDGFRRLRKAELIDALLERQGGDATESEPDSDADGAKKEAPRRQARPRRGSRDAGPPPAAADEPRSVEGIVELLPNGSGFVRVAGPEHSDDDVYLSAAQARRCELVSGDRVSGPVRSARRSERFASLVRVETINGAPADQAVAGTKIDERPSEFPTAPLPLGDDDVLAAIGKFAPLGLGSRAVVVGPSRSGKSVIVQRLAEALKTAEDLDLEVLLVGVRPEELSGGTGEEAAAPVSKLTFAAPAEAQASAVEQAVERGRRVAARGGNAVLLIDTLDGLYPPAARRTLAAARKLCDGGSLTIVATAERPFGGETTVIALSRDDAEAPSIDGQASGTLRGDLLGAPR